MSGATSLFLVHLLLASAPGAQSQEPLFLRQCMVEKGRKAHRGPSSVTDRRLFVPTDIDARQKKHGQAKFTLHSANRLHDGEWPHCYAFDVLTLTSPHLCPARAGCACMHKHQTRKGREYSSILEQKTHEMLQDNTARPGRKCTTATLCGNAKPLLS